VAESENIYVKIGERGRLIERTANTPRDHVNLRGTGWVLKGSKGAPAKKDETAEPLPANADPTSESPTSVRAFAEATEAESGTGAKRPRVASGAGSSAAGSAGARADAASQAAVNS
jgi:uncharacterized membrane protein